MKAVLFGSYANPMIEHQIMLAKDIPYKKQFIRALNDMDIDIALTIVMTKTAISFL